MLRQQSFSERGWTWALLVLLLTGMAAGSVVLVAGGIFPDPLGQAARGYTLTGYMLGVLVIAVGTMTFAYSLRKRGLQESLLGRGSMMTWLWMHVALGVLGINLAVLHGGLGVVSYPMSSGKVLFWVFAALTITGICWRLIYRFVPPRAAQRVGNYSLEGMKDRIEELTTEIEKTAAGRPAAFRQLSDWLAQAPRSEPELQHAAAHAQLDAESWEAISHIKQLVDSRRRAEHRVVEQRRYTRKQQLWRWLHVPLALAVVPLLVLHVLGATRVATRLLPLGAQPRVFSSFASSKDCKSCHRAIYEQWRASMHSHGMKSPVMIAQSNQVLKEVLADVDSPDPKLICVNCHGPNGIMLTEEEQGLLPLDRPGYGDVVMEGVGCVTCHQLTGKGSGRGEAGLTKFFSVYDLVGNTYYGPYDDPVGNAFHQSARGEIYDDPTRMCVSCHNVVYDKNGDGRIDKGVDLILQETTLEYDEYRAAGGKSDCLDCHMPRDDRTRSAESADMYFEQDGEAPKRVTRDHSFIAVDYPLDVDPKKDPQAKKRKKLQRSAATMELRSVGRRLTVSLTNSGCGHNLPTGLAFARQMWLEVKAFDGAGALVFSSGVLDDTDQDLCDAGTMDDVFRKFMKGCGTVDRNLVNFQLKLVDRIDTKKDARGNEERDEDGDRIIVAADGATESVLQRLTGGAVARRRPLDNTLLAPMEPEEERSFDYVLPFSARKVEVRLLFRSFGPYFLRALADGQPKREKPRLGSFVKNLQIDEMARDELTLR